MTRAELQVLRDAWYAAALAVATGQEYVIGTRRLTRADAATIDKMLAKYDGLLSQAAAGRPAGPRAFRVMPRDL